MLLVYMLPSGEFLWSLFKKLEKAEILVKTTICFHNFLCQTNNTGYCPTGFVDYSGKKGELKEGEWWSLVAKSQSRMLIFHPLEDLDQPSKLFGVREKLKSYINSMEGSGSWQWDQVRSGWALRQTYD